PQFFLVKEQARCFAEQIARELEPFKSPSPLPVETAAAIRAFREEWRFRTANDPAVQLWESPKQSMDWTVLFDPAETIPGNPLHRTFIIKPFTASSEAGLSLLRKHIGTIGIHPLNSESIDLAVRLGAQRICPIGQMQEPAIDWHHDGFPSLGSLVRFIDLERKERWSEKRE
ncbi:MAG TPA: acyl-CoA reductase, partial [Chthoniobacterales bacterium]|nr:acyl-CoA reductase [Chthoniobacterales bacterium]